jgi:hypothetical protein
LRGPFVAPHRKRVTRQIASDNLDPSHGYRFRPSRAPAIVDPVAKKFEEIVRQKPSGLAAQGAIS